jgi:hypothetical protein
MTSQTTEPFVTAVLSVLQRREVIEALAESLRPHLAPYLDLDEDRWMDINEASVYLSVTPNAIHKLRQTGDIPCHQAVPGGKLWFLRSELDAWRRQHGRSRFHRASIPRRNGECAGKNG